MLLLLLLFSFLSLLIGWFVFGSGGGLFMNTLHFSYELCVYYSGAQTRSSNTLRTTVYQAVTDSQHEDSTRELCVQPGISKQLVLAQT